MYLRSTELADPKVVASHVKEDRSTGSVARLMASAVRPALTAGADGK